MTERFSAWTSCLIPSSWTRGKFTKLPDNNEKKTSAYERLGTATILTLIVGTTAIILCAVFLSFFWYCKADSGLWQYIILRDGASRAVTTTTIILRTTVAAQSGVCLSMLAAITLERSWVPLASVAEVSMMRANNGMGLVSTVTGFVLPMLRRGPRLERLIVPLVLLILIILGLSQGISTALLFDITIKLVPGPRKTVPIAYDFMYQNGSGYTSKIVSTTSLWQANPPLVWPMFAEYSQPPNISSLQGNVSDTGRSLRAFLPLNATARESICNYSGMALVLDSRVTCQQPVLSEISVSNDTITGNVGASVATERLDTPGMVTFTCTVGLSDWAICELNEDADTGHKHTGDENSPNLKQRDSGTRYSIGANQIMNDIVKANQGGLPNYVNLSSTPSIFSGGLVSEFRELHSSSNLNRSGAAFLVIAPQNQSASKFGTEFIEMNTTSGPYAMSLCYTSLDVADRRINAYSAVAAHLNTSHASDLSPSSSNGRGVMRFQLPHNLSAALSNQSSNDGPAMILPNDDTLGLHCLTWGLHLKRTDGNIFKLGNQTAILPSRLTVYDADGPDTWFYSAVWLHDLFVQFPTAVALQAVITSLAGIEYYNRLGQFDKFDNVSMVPFVQRSTPGGPLGQRRTARPWGLGAVFLLLMSHLTLVVIVTIRFCRETTVSRVGDVWQAVSQLALSDVLRSHIKVANGDSKKDVTDYTQVHLAPGEKGYVVEWKEPTSPIEKSE